MKALKTKIDWTKSNLFQSRTRSKNSLEQDRKCNDGAIITHPLFYCRQNHKKREEISVHFESVWRKEQVQIIQKKRSHQNKVMAWIRKNIVERM